MERTLGLDPDARDPHAAIEKAAGDDVRHHPERAARWRCGLARGWAALTLAVPPPLLGSRIAGPKPILQRAAYWTANSV